MTWNTIRNETGGNNTKCDKVNRLNMDKEYNKSVNAEIFSKYFLMIVENISCKITGSDEKILNCTKNSLSYLAQVINFPFTNIVLHNTSTEKKKKNYSLLPLEKLMWL
jgi:2C-methyl-D-erythritol 2,4-cyclodiphosphate synthase